MLLTLITFLVVLTILVLVHEMGHFLAAKKAGIKVEEFGFGYPPRIWGKKIGETIYSINALPVGGFVRLYGEELRSAGKITKEKSRAFWAKSKKARSGVILAGVLANFLLAILVFSISYSVLGIPEETDKVTVLGSLPGTPAKEAGLKEGDWVSKIDGQVVVNIDDFIREVDQKRGQDIEVLVKRGEQELAFFLPVRENPPEGEGPLGVIISNIEMVHYPFWQMPFRGGVEGVKEAFAWLRMIVKGLGMMFSNLVSQGTVPRDVAGPLGILQLTGTVAQEGVLPILQFIGILSVNLVVLNALPFPALDGGRMVFIVYETVTKKRPNPKVEGWTNAAGMAFILIFLVLVTVNDLSRIWRTTEVAARFKTLWPF